MGGDTVGAGFYETNWSDPVMSDSLWPHGLLSLPRSSVHGIFQARVLEWVAISFSRGSSWSRDRTWVSHIVGRHFTVWATREILWKSNNASLPPPICTSRAGVRWFLGSLSVLLDSAICALMPFPAGGVGISFGDLSPPSYSVSYQSQRRPHHCISQDSAVVAEIPAGQSGISHTLKWKWETVIWTFRIQTASWSIPLCNFESKLIHTVHHEC